MTIIVRKQWFVAIPYHEAQLVKASARLSPSTRCALKWFWIAGRLTLLAFLLFIANPVRAATYYVSPDGTPTGDGSREKPWPVDSALAKGGGNTYIFLPGIYRGPMTLQQAQAGSANQPTVLRSEVKWKARIFGAPYHVINIQENTPYVIIDGFEVWGAGQDGIKSFSDDTTIRNCWVHNNSYMGISMHNRRTVVIENNLVEFNGMHPQFDHGIYADGENFIVRGNIVRHNAGYGIHLWPRITHATIVNNLVYGQANRAGIILQSSKEGEGLIVVNNTVARNAVGLNLRWGRGTIIENNIFFQNEQTFSFSDVMNPHVDYNLYDSPPQGYSKGPHDLTGDPGFIRTRWGIYWLCKDSSAREHGDPKVAPDTDLWGRPRPKDRTPDLGAYQFIPSIESQAIQWQYTKERTIPDLWQVPTGKDVPSCNQRKGRSAGSAGVPPARVGRRDAGAPRIIPP
jgi:parallel beta-helix repeat protein